MWCEGVGVGGEGVKRENVVGGGGGNIDNIH